MNATYVTSATTSSTRLQADSSKSQSHHAVLNNLSAYIYSKTKSKGRPILLFYNLIIRVICYICQIYNMK